MKRAKRKPSVGKLMVQGMREALAYHRGELTGVRVTRALVTVRSIDVSPPPEYGDTDIRRVRQQLGVSQAVFADLLGASSSTVRAWERGARKPSVMARRLIALAEREPQVFERDLVPNGGSRRGLDHLMEPTGS